MSGGDCSALPLLKLSVHLPHVTFAYESPDTLERIICTKLVASGREFICVCPDLFRRCACFVYLFVCFGMCESGLSRAGKALEPVFALFA